MKNIETKITSLPNIIQKRNFLVDVVMVELHPKPRNYWAFFESVGNIIKRTEPTPELNQLIDGVFGYYLYSQKAKIDPKQDILHDLNGFLKFTLQGKTFNFKTKNYKCYLKK